MEQTEDMFYELRIYLIGDIEVGKRAIASRFKILNSTKTLQDKHFIPRDPREAYGLGQIKDKKLIEIYNSKSIEEKMFIRKEIERLELMTFSKIFNVGNISLTLNCFPILEAEPLPSNYEPKEEDEDYEFERAEHMSLQKVKGEIKKYLLKDPKTNNCNVIHLFMFCFDLSDYTTFERIQVYFFQLNKLFKFDNSGYVKIMVGNKVDIKNLKQTNQKESIEAFAEKNGMKYYEISTLLFFNFEKFFELIFFENIAESSDDFKKDLFQKRFHLLISIRPTFPLAERVTFKYNDNPGPNNYDNNVYEYCRNKKEFRQTFDNTTKRFIKKIFINKIGPILPTIQKDMKKMDKKEKKKSGNQNRTTDIGFADWDVKTKKELKETLEVNIPGYSLGIRKGLGNYKQERKDRYNEQTKKLNDVLQENTVTLHIKHEPILRANFKLYEENRKANLKETVDAIKEMEDEGRENRNKILKEQEIERDKKIKQIEEKAEKYQKKFNEKERRVNQARILRKSSSADKTKDKVFTPGPDTYDIRGKINLNKGYTFGSRTVYAVNKNKFDPGFNNLKSDFDLIVQERRNCSKNSEKRGAERFPAEKIHIPGEPTKIKAKWSKWNDNKTSTLNAKKQELFFALRKQKNFQAKDQRRNIEKMLLEELEEKLRRRARIDEQNIHIRTINYGLVEDKAPIYSMKGKYEHGGIFDAPDYDVSKDDLDINDAEGMNSDKDEGDKKKAKDVPYPLFNAVKPSIIGFSFTHANRFYGPKILDSNSDKDIFHDGVFMPSDCIQYSNQQATMGKSKKGTELLPSTIPGPGHYKIPGFADIVVREGEKVNQIRTAIRTEEKRKETLENEKANKSNGNIEPLQHNNQNGRGDEVQDQEEQRETEEKKESYPSKKRGSQNDEEEEEEDNNNDTNNNFNSNVVPNEEDKEITYMNKNTNTDRDKEMPIESQ